MLQNEGLSPLKCMTFFFIPIVKSNTPLFLDTIVRKQHIEAFAIIYNTRWQNFDHLELPLRSFLMYAY